MEILCVQGSLGRPSRTAAMTSRVVEMLNQLNISAEFIDLSELCLPIPDASSDRQLHREHPDPVIRKIVTKAQAADAFVLATPIYHNSYSGVLKCFLDHLGIQHFAHKPVALCGNSGRTGSVQPVDHLRIVIRGLHGVAIPYQAVSRNSDYVVEGREIRSFSEDLQNRLESMVNQLIQYSIALKPIREAIGESHSEQLLASRSLRSGDAAGVVGAAIADPVALGELPSISTHGV
ncbi:azobenzene reductase [Streptomyces umbrinus]|uniref:Azobenzene reductase n=1 Tax=Streptomyces umbrinus TaxID=67370 RepID=A0ABU0SMF2_9ACTN|nr:NAD(P)H-dependent oxidoreductase [Streptomyces umbrinus]MDQ1024741.1 azobenzene reductase [Streptomyces umbrinus]